MSAAERWRADLAKWAIPDEILARAPESPWIHPPELFELPEVIAGSPSHDRAREALGAEASVLDVGCGGGAATFALVPDVKWAVGVDHQDAMLAMYERNGRRFSVPVSTIAGDWPEVAPRAPRCDVAVAHHVVYNVGEIAAFLAALHTHARHRVVLEMPVTHPLSGLADTWRHFWNLERPSGPTPRDLVAVVGELGFAPHLETWEAPARPAPDVRRAAHFLRIRLCLPAEREGEVREYLAATPPPRSRELATLWWDVTN